MAPERTGSCLCGSISLKIKPDANVLLSNTCYCAHCLKSTGSAYFIAAHFDAKDIEYTDPKGTMKTHSDAATDSGSAVLRSFCSECGSRVKIQSQTSPQMIGVPLGILDGDDKDDLKPTTEFFVARKFDWLPSLGWTKKFSLMP